MSSLFFHEEAAAYMTCFLRRILVISVRVCDCETRTEVSSRHANIYKQRGRLLMGHIAGLLRVFLVLALVDVTLTCQLYCSESTKKEVDAHDMTMHPDRFL